MFPFKESKIKTSKKVYGSKESLPSISALPEEVIQASRELVEDNVNSQHTVSSCGPGHEANDVETPVWTPQQRVTEQSVS